MSGSAVRWRVLLGALLLSFAFGSLHAFGVLLEPLQAAFASSRAGVSLGYSLAIAALTLGVYLSGRLELLGDTRRGLFLSLAGAGGLLLAASGQSLAVFLVGYGIVFGLSNGLAYAFMLERASDAVPAQGGLAVGVATAVYGLGAVVATQGLAVIVSQSGAQMALLLQGFVIATAGIVAAALFSCAAPTTRSGSGAKSDVDVAPRRLAVLWLVYFLGALGGLMAIAHSVAIAGEHGAATDHMQMAAALIAAGNVAGSVLGGLYAGRVAARRALLASLIVTAAALWFLLLLRSSAAALALVAICGAGYGALISVVPVVVRRAYGDTEYQRAFGRVFTAWGAAGLAGPLLGGLLFDLWGGYDLAIAVAAICASIAGVVAILPKTYAGRGLPPTIRT